MKRILPSFILLFLLIGCTNTGNTINLPEEKEEPIKNYYFSLLSNIGNHAVYIYSSEEKIQGNIRITPREGDIMIFSNEILASYLSNRSFGFQEKTLVYTGNKFRIFCWTENISDNLYRNYLSMSLNGIKLTCKEKCSAKDTNKVIYMSKLDTGEINTFSPY